MSEGDEQVDNGLSETLAYPFKGHRIHPILPVGDFEDATNGATRWVFMETANKQQQQTAAQVKWLLAKQLKIRLG